MPIGPIFGSKDKPIETADDAETEDVGENMKKVKNRSTHFGDSSFDLEAFEGAQDVTWGDVFRRCCCHDAQGWFRIFIGLCIVCFILYWFMVGLELLGTSAKCLTGCVAGELFGEANPVASVMIGMIATVLLQSSSTTTSIIVSLVASGLSVNSAIYMVMGANIGTSVTNTIVAMGEMGHADELERAFAGATVHDMFNFLTVLILLPVEAATHYLYYLTKAITPQQVGEGDSWESPFKIMLDPIVKKMIISNKNLLKDVASGEKSCADFYPVTCEDGIVDYKHCNPGLIACNKSTGQCPAFFQNGSSQADDMASAGVNLFIGLLILTFSLVCLVMVLKKLLLGASQPIIYKATSVNGYFSMIIGALLTMAVQSSSVTTSALTPLVGIGVLPLAQMFPLTLGANIGTTITGLLAAGVSGSTNALQVALAHLFFNITGIIIWYPIPFMRRIPINLARQLGKYTRIWKGFPVLYIAVAFFIIPLILLGLSELLTSPSLGILSFGIILVILLFLLVVRLVFWWWKQDGRNITMKYFESRQRKSEALKNLPENMELCLSEIQILKERAGISDESDKFDKIEENIPTQQTETLDSPGQS